MNLQPSDYINKKRYTVKSVKTEDSTEDYSETNKRSKEEFAKDFLRAYGDSLKRIMRGEKLRSIDDLLKEANEYIEEEKRNGRF